MRKRGIFVQDHIFLRDYRKTIEIGAFQEERQILQEIVISIDVTLAEKARADDDFVDDILSYDVLVNAVEDNLAAHRYDLLEALAEDIAAQILREKAADSVEIEIQKLGRVDGALGIHMKRKSQGEHQALSVQNSHELFVIYDSYEGELRGAAPMIWLPMQTFDPITHPADQHILAHQLNQNAWQLSKFANLPVVDTQTEMQSLIQRGKSFILAFGKPVFASPAILDEFSEGQLIAWAQDFTQPSQTTILK